MLVERIFSPLPTLTFSLFRVGLFIHINPCNFRARTFAGAKAPHLHRTCGFFGCRTGTSARRCMDGGPFHHRHIQPINDPLPSFIICKFSVSTYPVNFNLSMSHKSKQLISLVKTIPSRICFVTGIS